jgi:hypothetical protein
MTVQEKYKNNWSYLNFIAFIYYPTIASLQTYILKWLELF